MFSKPPGTTRRRLNQGVCMRSRFIAGLGIGTSRPAKSFAVEANVLYVVGTRGWGSSVPFPVLSKERHLLRSDSARFEIQHGLLVAVRMLLSPELEQ
jgi:hypothetical protein